MEQNNVMEEISLRELIEILIKRKKMIAIVTSIAMITSLVFSFLILKPTYEAKMIVMASNASENLEVNSMKDIGNVENMLNAISKYPSMNIETYKQQVKTPEVIGKTIKELGLEEEYSIESLSDDIILETTKDTQLINIKMINTNPEKAAAIVNKVGENFISVVSDSMRKRSTASSEYVKTQMEVEKEIYDKALLEQKELLSQPRGASEVGLELNVKLEQITEYKSKLNDLHIRQNALEASIEVAEKTSSRGNGIIINRESGNLLIDDSTKTLKIELADTKASLDSIKESIERLQKEIEELQIELQEKKHKESIVAQKVEVAQKTYEAFIKKYEELRVAESSMIGEASITVISKAFSPTRPVGPRKALNLAIATVLGLMVGVFIAFFLEYWQSTDTKNRNDAVLEIKE